MKRKTDNLKRKKLMAGGGSLGDPKRPKAGTAYSVVSNNIKYPLTDLNVADEIIQRGWGTNRDSIMSLTPEARQSMIPSGSDVTFDRKSKAPFGSANAEGYKYYKSIPKVTGRTLQIPGKTINNPTADILSEWGYAGGGPFDEYSFGGWLKENIGDIAKTAAGVGAMFIPGAQGVGAGLIAGGVGGMVSGDGNKNEVSEVYKPAVSKSRQIYDPVIAEGGTNLKRLSQRTDYKGEDHSQGGINLPIGAQVETGESRTGDIVHSDKIKITPAIMKRYGGNILFKKGDRGRSVADVVKSRDKRFEKRSGDEWNDQARKVSQMPFEAMSDELSQIYDIAKEMSVDFVPDNMKAGGGSLSKFKARKMLKDGKVRGKPITDKQRKYFGWASENGTGAGGLDLSKFLGDEGNAPIIGSAVGLVTNLLRKPEKVKYDQASFTPTTVTPISTEAGINRIKRSFGSSRERLRRLNPRGYMNNLTNMAASEAETIGDYTGQVQGQNADVSNRASMIDSQNRSRTSMFNSQISMQEAEANAANRGMRRTAIDANMNNLFTQIGQKSKDEKMMKAQEDYQNKMFELQKGYQDIWKDSIDKGSSGIDIPNVNFLEGLNTDDYNTQSDYKKRQGFAGGGSLINKTTALLGKRRYRTY